MAILFSYFPNSVYATNGVYLFDNLYSVSSFKCLKEYPIDFAIVRGCGKNTELNIINAQAAGINDVDIYFPPCVQCRTSGSR
uniref:2-Hacid_dh domain-containing protein n=1 Tax=Meloidogyne hapla TaxID=6305 RepID=A0A1I8BW17_MELHA